LLARNELAEYLAAHYGECALGSGRCYHGPGPMCLRTGNHFGCPHWKPTTATTWDELKAEASKMYDVK